MINVIIPPKAAKQDSKPSQDVGGADESSEDVSIHRYGELPLNQSQVKETRAVTRVEAVGPKLVDKTVLIRARVHTSRTKGKQCFVVLRQGRSSIQGLVAVGPEISKQMLKFVTK